MNTRPWDAVRRWNALCLIASFDIETVGVCFLYLIFAVSYRRRRRKSRCWTKRQS
jgi:hypothetical protein